MGEKERLWGTLSSTREIGLYEPPSMFRHGVWLGLTRKVLVCIEGAINFGMLEKTRKRPAGGGFALKNRRGRLVTSIDGLDCSIRSRDLFVIII